MKKTIMLFALTLFMSVYVMAQSQRLVLLEHFTQASCGYCPPWNTAYESLKAANPGKFTIIRHQVSWPGYDPMNTQYAPDVATRVSYYGITGVPDSRTDGTLTGQMTQTTLNSEYAIASPFTMALSHTFNPSWDSVTVTCIITCTQAVSVTGPLMGHIVMTEEWIHYATAPGSNGETDFYNVARDMYPSAAGATLATTWAVGDKDTLTYKEKVPTYLYNPGQIAFVAFIQDNATKSVKQSAYSAPQPLPLDAGISAVANVPTTILCAATPFTPTATLKNYGTATLTACNVNYKIDNGTVTTIPWTGSLATGTTTTVTLSAVTPTGGQHILSVYTSAPNAGTDLAPVNDALNSTFKNASTFTAAPIIQDFQGTTFPPSLFLVNNPNNDAATWTRKTGAGGFGTSTACAKMDFYNSSSGRLDDLYTDPVDLTGITVANIAFDVAYAQYSSENDRLQVQVSTDCGTTWATKFDKQGAALSTAPATTASFTPSAAQWRHEVADISSVGGQASVLVRFHAISAYGNNAYVDNINISSGTGVVENNDLAGNVSIYPNPLTDQANIIINLKETSKVSYTVCNILGEVVYSENAGTVAGGSHEFIINATGFSAGMYFVNIMVGDQMVTKKITVNR